MISWSVLTCLAQNVRVKESSVFSRKYYTEVTKLSTLSVFEIEVWCYRGGDVIPKWIDRQSGQCLSLLRKCPILKCTLLLHRKFW